MNRMNIECDPIYRLLLDEVRHALSDMRQGRHLDAERTLEAIVLVGEFVERYRHHDPEVLRMAEVVRRLDWERTPEGRLELERILEQDRRYWVGHENRTIEPSPALQLRRR